MALLMRYEWPGNVRELKNLVESMVVLAPGRVIQPQDIPPEIRSPVPGHLNLLPAPMPRSAEHANGPTPELEFIFRTLIQLRMDVDDLRRQFEDYQTQHPELPGGVPIGYPPVPLVPAGRAIDVHVADANGTRTEVEADDESTVVFRPGITMADLEKQAITAALRQVAGNRRKAAEMLGMGERTLYRKIKEYGIPL
jgi:DNA-binding NtrC family response regulator